MWNDPAVKGSLQPNPYRNVAPICPALVADKDPLASMTFAIGLAGTVTLIGNLQTKGPWP
jgi:hypothetical protein